MKTIKYSNPFRFTSFAGLALVATTIFALSSCDPENPNNPNEQEVITSVKITAIRTGIDTVEFAYSDPDGDGGNVPTIDTLHLVNGSTYHVSLDFIDETKNPDEIITDEIHEEGVDHQIFYTSNSAALSTAYADTDANGHPIGLLSTWSASGVVSGNLTLTLKHQPGIKDGLITTGETDVEVVFPFVIE